MLANVRFVARFALFAAVLTGATARAQTLFETLVLPGPVISGHAKIESQCGQCHEPGSRKSQPKLCLACHKDVGADIADKRGYHGRDPTISAQDCKHCHTDHKGASFDIVQLDRETFNHARTNFALTGAHASVTCNACHPANTKFRKAPGTCGECHKAGDPHKGRLGSSCESCHEDTSWHKTKPFDHGRTKFPLVGAHRDVACSGCHAGEKYAGLGLTCVACHKPQDKHGGRYGDKCETCHSARKWSEISFDHGKATKFALHGRHGQVACDACHTGDLYRVKLKTTCVSCHGKADPHKGQLGTACERCHVDTGWRQKVSFDHDVTRFPLVGLHKGVACEECHKSQRFKEAPMACAKCHADTHHEGRLGPACEQCHNPNGWTRWRFDHSKQTHFPLTGAHNGLDCHACHRAKVTGRIVLGSTCFGCHAADDAHSGSFGTVCEQCHDTTSFKKRGFNP